MNTLTVDDLCMSTLIQGNIKVWVMSYRCLVEDSPSLENFALKLGLVLIFI